MRRVCFTATGLVLMLGLALTVRADGDSARAIVDRAIKAHGGADKLKKLNAIQLKMSGTLDFMGGAKFTGEIFVQAPDRFKNVIETQINNMNLVITQVFDGKRFWINVLGKTEEVKDEQLIKELKENAYTENLANLVGLTDKGVELSPLGEVKVNGKDAVGIRASSKGHRDVNLYFDKTSGLLAKSECRSFSQFSKQEVNEAKVYSGYKEIAGIQQASRIVISHDDKRHLTVEIIALEIVDRHDASIFAKP